MEEELLEHANREVICSYLVAHEEWPDDLDDDGGETLKTFLSRVAQAVIRAEALRRGTIDHGLVDSHVTAHSIENRRQGGHRWLLWPIFTSLFRTGGLIGSLFTHSTVEMVVLSIALPALLIEVYFWARARHMRDCDEQERMRREAASTEIISTADR